MVEFSAVNEGDEGDGDGEVEEVRVVVEAGVMMASEDDCCDCGCELVGCCCCSADVDGPLNEVKGELV